MKFSEHWLREYANPAGDTAALVHQLTMQGLEVESLDPAAPPLPGVVVGRVLEVRPHPNADRLRVCRVDAGVTPLQIVCGASNVQVGGVYPVACIGAKLPDGTSIKPAKLRGEASEGMLCSATELGLAEKSDGLLELDAGLLPGQSIAEALGLDDQILDLKITPNRADCFCVTGIARDLAAAIGVPFKAPPATSVVASTDETISVSISNPDDCTVFVSRVIRGVRGDALSSVLAARTPAPERYPQHQSGRRCHQLRDARAWSAIACLRSGQAVGWPDGASRHSPVKSCNC